MARVGDRQFNDMSGMIMFFAIFTLIIIGKLFYLQIIQHNYYSAMALGYHEIYQKLHPERGAIYFSDVRTNELHPAAMNRIYYKVFVVPKDIKYDEIEDTAQKLEKILELPEEDGVKLRSKLGKRDDPYEPIARKITEEKIKELDDLNLEGVHNIPETYRYYPEGNISANILGFCAKDEKENLIGKYGIEGYWNENLSGKSGFLAGEMTARGSWIARAGLTTVEADNGSDLVLTIDRSLQYNACSRLQKGLEEFDAKSASLVMMDPMSGAILAMCSLPSYDSNNYSDIDDFSVYNNNTIFTPYEPGSVFKPLVMSIAIDLGLVNPNTTFDDPCKRELDNHIIHNALRKCYGDNVSMLQVLENSINTGMIWVSELIRPDRLKKYLYSYGFGQKSGVQMDTELAGNVTSLDKKSLIFSAQTSFGQGLTVTPLQLALAYSALANNGRLPKPYIVKEKLLPNGKVEKIEPSVATQVISPRTAKLVTGMLTSVVEQTYKRTVKMDDYYIAGKTGTAQISGIGGYKEDETNHTFGGFAPVKDPKFVIIVRFEAPANEKWAESTAAVVFKDITDFTLNYLGIENDK